MSGKPFQSVGAVLGIVLVSLVMSGGVLASESWVVGEGGHSWESIGTSMNLEEMSDWLQPIDVTGENLSLGVRERGGWIRASHFREVALNAGINGDHTDGWGATLFYGGLWKRGWVQVENEIGDRYNTDQYQDITVIIDLGAPFGVDRISFYTREGFEDRFIRGYQIFVNEGREMFIPPPPLGTFSEWQGTPTRTELWYSWYPFVRDWKILAEEEDVGEEVLRVGRLDLSIPLEIVRYIAINDYISLPDSMGWEIEEFEVWGRGYAMAAEYISDVIDLEGLCNLGRIIWAFVADPGTSVILRTRTGRTPEPYIYHEKTGLGLTGETEISKQRYNSLPVSKRGTMELDMKNWSDWTVPYPQTGDEPMAALGPQRAFQFRIMFLSDSPEARARLRSLSLEYSEVLMAREIVGELSPQWISPGELTAFRYDLLAVFGPENTGFDAVRIRTPVAVDPSTIRDLRIDGIPVEEFSVEADGSTFTLRFPENRLPPGRQVDTTDSVHVMFRFDCRVFIYGTRFSGEIFDSRTEEVPQDILAGDATSDVETNDLSVKWALGGNLITDVEISSHLLTPNGDGVHDEARISYSLLQLAEPAPVSMSIYALSGELVFERTARRKNGAYTVVWDGKDDKGEKVLPGVYVYRLVARTEDKAHSHAGTIAVVY